MTLKQYKTAFSEKLSAIYDAGEIESFFYLILENKLGLRRIDMAMQPDFNMEPSLVTEWDIITEQLLREVPVQYLLGKTHFFGLEFKVTKNVLIPRPETEELVAWVIEENQSAKSILDIGTGSGAIAVSLAKNIPEASVHAIDVSPEALAVAEDNATALNADVHFILQDILSAFNLPYHFDCIVSNPPYVRHLEKEEIKKNVLDYEPHLALFVEDNDPLLFYRKIGHLAFENLNSGGKLYFEINQYLGKEMQDLMVGIGFEEVILKKDMYGNDRMIRGIKK